jgi:hypothetical protein
MHESSPSLLYEISLNLRVAWHAQSLSNAGNNGSNRLLPRRQLLAGGTETDACSGNIAKHFHAMLLAEYLEAAGCPLCPARHQLVMDAELPHFSTRPTARHSPSSRSCVTVPSVMPMAFSSPAKRLPVMAAPPLANVESKHSLIEFSFALALPDHHAETIQLMTRIGDSKDDGQMLMRMTARSGEYALCIRYKCAGIGLDTDKWTRIIADEQERGRRHRAILTTLRDCLLSPQGALTATMLPHLTGLRGAIAICPHAGRAPIYSALQDDFITRLCALHSETCLVLPFETIDAFHLHMRDLIEHTHPALPMACQLPNTDAHEQ